MTNRAKQSGMSETVRSSNALAFSSDSSEILAKSAESFLAATAEWHREVMAFASMRIEKNGAALRAMMGSRSLADVTAMQSRWVQDTLSDYNAEMAKLMTIYTRSAQG